MPLFSIGDRRVELVGAHHYVAYDATPLGIAHGYVERSRYCKNNLKEIT